jgi:hypothetical protein
MCWRVWMQGNLYKPKGKKKARRRPGFFLVTPTSQVPRVCVAFTAMPQNVPETVAV